MPLVPQNPYERGRSNDGLWLRASAGKITLKINGRTVDAQKGRGSISDSVKIALKDHWPAVVAFWQKCYTEKLAEIDFQELVHEGVQAAIYGVPEGHYKRTMALMNKDNAAVDESTEGTGVSQVHKFIIFIDGEMVREQNDEVRKSREGERVKNGGKERPFVPAEDYTGTTAYDDPTPPQLSHAGWLPFVKGLVYMHVKEAVNP